MKKTTSSGPNFLATNAAHHPREQTSGTDNAGPGGGGNRSCELPL